MYGCSPPYKGSGFGARLLKNSPQIIPLAFCIGTACIGAATFIGYSLVTKPDVRINKFKVAAPYETVADSCKLLTVNLTNYEPNQELDRLREEIGSYAF